MIPTFRNLKFYLKVNLKRLNYPPERVLSSEDGLVCNQEYTDIRNLGWGAFEETYQIEKEAIDYANNNSKTAEEFDEILADRDDVPIVEVGIGSIAFALSAFGCAPVLSCRGHPVGSSYDGVNYPHVGFWAQRKKAKELVSILNGYVLKEKDKHIGIDNAEMEGYRGLILYANNIPSLMNFANYLSKPITSNSKINKKK